MNIDLKTIKTLYHSKNIIKPQTKQSIPKKKKKKPSKNQALRFQPSIHYLLKEEAQYLGYFKPPGT